MNKIICSFAALFITATALFGQTSDYIKRPALGIHFFLNDFKTAYSIRATSIKATFRDHTYSHIRQMDPGLAVSYLQGLGNHFDISSALSASFLDYPDVNNVSLGDNQFLLEWDAMIHAKLLSDKHVVSPYLSAGIGASKYGGYYGAFLPVGAGVQVNIANEAFILFDTQYRMRVSENTNYHFYHSIGIAGNIGKAKTPKVIPPPPIPLVAPPSDRDGDGVVDSLDACPDVAGLKQFHGCPDTDGDGIPDKDDKCPTVPGVARYQGCPVPDTDGDGVNDEEDKCPTVVGVARYQGCPVPDTDGDGVNDEEDKCPTVPGTRENNGCPVISAAVAKKMEIASRSIFFATGSASLLPQSFTSLNSVVKLLADSAGLKLNIDGHTDNTGKPEANQVLSQKRADAVKDYLVKKGVDATRIIPAGHGQDEPVADNKTAAGRSKNRRVELKLRYY